MAYGDIELTAPRDESWHQCVDDAIQRASCPVSIEAVPIRRNGLRIAYVVGANYLDQLVKTADAAGEVAQALRAQRTGGSS
jgi:hypothetical protein